MDSNFIDKCHENLSQSQTANIEKNIGIFKFF